MLTNATHYEQVSLETVKEILARKVVLHDDAETQAGGPDAATKSEPLKRQESGKGRRK